MLRKRAGELKGLKAKLQDHFAYAQYNIIRRRKKRGKGWLGRVRIELVGSWRRGIGS